ncbi:glycosyl transferase, group 2 family protein [Verrucomicrobiia bacterium DG1235]|nr:glycosyl transferase, group 2 family protein [Verrucomicrobiae bacterium DG1235]
MALDITILIPARDAAATIERCVYSLVDQDAAQIILIDDFSTDDTVIRAQAIAGKLLKVVSPAEHINVPHARNAGLAAVQTRYAIWCDADDCYLPGRVKRLYDRLQNEAIDFISDAQELYDGKTNRKLRDLPIPSFIQSDRDKVRLFERNYLPGIGHIAFDVEFARKIRYDPQQFGGDDSDFVFRLIAAGARMGVCQEIGYRMYAYPGSDSRNIARQKKMVARALQKHDYAFVQSLHQKAGFSDRVTAWGLVSMATFREDYQAALNYLRQAFPQGSDPQEILEPTGPYPLPEGWRHAFTLGTLYLLQDQPNQAISNLEKCLEFCRSPDVLNNLGVAHSRIGDHAHAKKLFAKALVLFPNYLDARLNQNNVKHITPHPIRLQPSRNDY